MHGATDSFERVLDRLERVARKGSGQALAACPVGGHGQGRGDRNPSLHVSHDGERVLLHCPSGCHVQDVMMAAGLDWPDLFDEELVKDELLASWTYQQPDGSPYFTIERWQKADGGKRFLQRMPDGRSGYPSGFKTCLYHLPAVLAEAKKGGTVYIVEGEKSVSAANRLGLVATTGPNGCKGWKPWYPKWLEGCSQIVVVTDNDEPGMTGAAQITASLRGHGLNVQTVRGKVATPGADLYDHVLAGFGVEDLVPVNLNRLRPEGTTMTNLLTKDYPEPKFAVPGLIASGLTLFGGAPKLGKSFIALDLALGVACGGRALSYLACNQGSVLYLSLDNDTPRRLKARALDLMGGRSQDLADAAAHIEVHTDWPTGNAALAACQEWVNDTDDPLLIVVDTLVRVEPAFEGDGRGNAYASSTELLGRWAKFAIEADICLVTVHHDRKAEADDWLNRFTGSRGITATAQTLLMIEAERGKRTGTLRVTGRDVETDDLAMERLGRSWAVTDPVDQGLRSVG